MQRIADHYPTLWAMGASGALVLNMISYYANKKAPRSTAFGVSLAALLGLLITDIVAGLGQL